MKGFQLHQQLSEEEIILNSKAHMLYSHDFEKGRFFQVVYDEPTGFEVKLAAKTMLKVVYLKEKDDIEGFEIIKVVSGQPKQSLTLSKFNLQQVHAFLTFISKLDLKAISERRLRLADDDELDPQTIKRVKTILSKEGGDRIIKALIDEGILTHTDLVNTAYRKHQLDIFHQMLQSPDYWEVYAEENRLNDRKEEKIWQQFFSKNDWIFGYGLDYRFNGILQKEFHASESQADGSGSVVTDFLLGDKRFTTFVEIKKPSTPMFGGRMNRANSWSLSRELFDAVSQILEHKASGEVRLQGKELYDERGDLITQKPYDSKVVLVIGDWNRCEFRNANEKRIKEKTFELYRRDSRNIKILTYDELYERAQFIVEHKARASSG